MRSNLSNKAGRERVAHEISFSVETELLLACVASDAGHAENVARAIARGVNWDVFLQMVVAHGVIAPVYGCLADSAIDGVPSAALSALRRRYMANVLHGRQITRELNEVIGLLATAGVRALAVKGPVLSLLAYNEVSARQYTDLDLLVRRDDVRHAIDCLASGGYVSSAGCSSANIDRPGWFEIALTRPGALAALDLHWRLIPPYLPVTLDGEDLWRRAVSVNVEGCEIMTLAPEDQVLYLCAHGAKHGWQTLGGVSDLARLMRASALDWAAMWSRAQRVGARRMLLLGVLLAHDLFGTEVPERMLEAASSERAVAGAARTFIRYAAESGCAGPKLYQRWSIPARMIEQRGARIRYLASRAFLPSADDQGFVRLPPALASLYYVLRPLRIALKGITSAIGGMQPAGSPSVDRPVS